MILSSRIYKQYMLNVKTAKFPERTVSKERGQRLLTLLFPACADLCDHPLAYRHEVLGSILNTT